MKTPPVAGIGLLPEFRCFFKSCLFLAAALVLPVTGAHAAAFGWGNNTSGQIGNGAVLRSSLPLEIPMTGALAGKVIVSTAVGNNHTVALTADGLLYSWGLGTNGQIGNGTTMNSALPVAVDMTGVLAGKTITSIAAGGDYSVVRTSDGKVFGWGTNTSGQLGNGTNTNSSIPVAVDMSGALAGKSVSAIAVGNAQAVAITSDGKAYSWGGGTRGDGSYFVSSNRPVAISMAGVLSGKTVTSAAVSSGGHVLLLTSEGKVYGFGNNGNYQLGDGSNTNATLPVAMYMGGVLAGKTVTAIGGGGFFSVMLTSEGKIYTVGNNGEGVLGDGTSVPNATLPVAVITSGALSGKTVTAISVASNSVMALTSEGKLLAWGSSTQSQLGNGTVTSANMPVPVDTSGVLSNITLAGISLGSHAIAWGSDGKLYGWGNNANGQFGTGDSSISTTPSAVWTSGLLAGKTVTSIAANGGAGSHTLLLTSDGKIHSFGTNTNGQLGNGTTTASNVALAVDMSGVLAGKTVTAISAGSSHSLALTSEGKIYAWGGNSAGQLGIGTTTASSVPIAVATDGELGGKIVTAIAGYGNHSMALTSDGRVYTWGNITPGNGNGAANFTRAVAAGNGGLIEGKTTTAISSGGLHAITLASDGTLYGWGGNSSGQVGDGTTTSVRLSPVAIGVTGLLAGKTVTAIATGDAFSLALTSEGKVYAWGQGNTGAMGNGSSTTSNPMPVEVSTSGVLSGKTITMISVGQNYATALASDGKLYAWGSGTQGQMGNGTTVATNNAPVAVNMDGVLAGKTVTALSAGSTHMMVLAADPVTTPGIAVSEGGNPLVDGGTEALDFAHSAPAGSGVEKVLTISNTGNADLILGAITLDGQDPEAFVAGAPVDPTVAPGASTTFTITFQPDSLGAKSATLHIASNVAGSANPFEIGLSGQGNTPPTFADYPVSTAHGTLVAISRTKLLAKATDADGDALTITAVAISENGVTPTLAGGTLNYQPATGFSGTDSFPVTITDARGAAVTGTVTVTVRPDNPGTGQPANAPLITTGGGTIGVTYYGIPGRTYEIQRSTDLTNWEPLATLVAAANGAVKFTDENPPPGSAFYRLKLP